MGATEAARAPGAVVRRIRELVSEAEAAGTNPDDVVDVLRVIWQR